MLVSVIVPVYNVEKYLAKCLDSILCQTYSNLEIIVVDDGSTDSSGAICDEYASKNDQIKVIHKKNAGLGMARNTGLDVITGDYVTFVDSDDYIEKDLIEVLMHSIISKNLNMCKCGFTRVQDDQKILSYVKYKNEIFESTQIKEQMIPRYVGSLPNKKDSIEMCVCGVMFDTDTIIKNHVRFPSEREMISEDLIFNLDYLVNIDKAEIIDYAGYNYRYNPSSLTKSYRNDRFEACKYFYSELKKKLLSIGYDGDIFLRLSKMFFIYLRMCLSQENTRVSGKKFKDCKIKILEICSDPVVVDIIKNYPIKELGFQQRFFLLLILKQQVWLLYLFSLYGII